MYSIDLKAFRKANKLTQAQLADLLGISRSFIGQVECGASKLPESYAQALLANKNYDTSMLVNNGTSISANASGNGTAKVNIDNSVKHVADAPSDALLRTQIEYLQKENDLLRLQLTKAEDDKQRLLDMVERLMKRD